jgi:hypothetical protein
MDDPSSLRKLLFWGVLVPIATLTLLAVGYLVFVLGVEHY